MSEYITKESAIEVFEWGDADVIEEYGDGSYNFGFGRGAIKSAINAISAADVAPVVHGDWIGYFPHCSVCGEEALSRDNGTLHGAYFLTDYCPNCGAKMDGGTINEL